MLDNARNPLMDRSYEGIDDVAESNHPDESRSVSGPSRESRGRTEMPPPPAQSEAFLKMSQDMLALMQQMAAPRAKDPMDQLRRYGAEEFRGATLDESERAEHWIEKIQRILDEIRCPPDQRVPCAVSLLQGSAYDWWKLATRSPQLPTPVTWEYFVQEFQAKYVTEAYRSERWRQFLSLRQRGMTVAEYDKEFSRLSKYAPETVLTERFRCRQFEDGLHESIKRHTAAVTTLQPVKYY